MYSDFKVNPESNMPVYTQVAGHIRRLITTGVLKNGSLLPGRAFMTDALSINKNTLAKALELLEFNGLVKSHPRKGFEVTYTLGDHGVNWERYFTRAKHKTATEDISKFSGSARMGALSSDFTPPKHLSEAFMKATRKLHRDYNKLEFSKYGYEPLRHTVKKYIERQGIFVDIDNIFIATEDALTIYHIYETLMTQGSVLFTEKYNIVHAITNIHSLGVNIMSLKCDGDGVIISDIIEKLPRNRNAILQIDATDNVPTGLIMSKKRRLEVVELAQKYRIPVVEIDHHTHIWHDQDDIKPMKAFDTTNNIIYIDSFVKMFPYNTQISWIVADKYLIERISNVFAQTAAKPNFFMQLLVNEALSSDKLEEFHKHVKDFVLERRQLTLDLCEKYLTGKAKWNADNCYYSFWIEFTNDDVHIKKILNKANNTSALAGNLFDKNDRTHVLIRPASITKQELIDTIKLLADNT